MLSIEPREAFGFPDEENIHQMSRSDFPEEMKIEEGMIVEFDTPSDERIPGALKEIKGDTVIVDFNHPLAGHEITFDVEIIDIKPAAS